MWKAARYPARWAWLAALAVLGSAASAAAQQQPVVDEGDRVRLWPGRAVARDSQAAPPLVGRLMGLGPDTLQVRAHFRVYAVPRGSIGRIERSLGQPHGLRNGAVAFAGTALVLTAINGVTTLATTGGGGDLGPEFGFIVVESVVALPVSLLAGALGILLTPERFEPASLPVPDPC